MSGNTAWVTLATNDTYCLGALVLANSLKRVNTVHQLAVLITPGVTQPMRQQLAKVFNVVKEVDVLDSGDEANLALIARPELGVTFTKLHCWNLTQFSKCVFLDADILVVQNSDELFEREELSAAPDVGWPDCFNSGVFVFVPSKETFKALIDCALAQGSFDGGDQGLLNIFFKDWPTKDIKKHLPFIYNMVSTASYSYLPAFKLFGSQVKIVHFIGSNKPWLQSGSAATSTLSGFLETWWSIFNSHVSQTLSTEMISNYSFDDVRWQNHSSFTQSPIPVHHSYEQFRGVNMVQEQPLEEERHQFADPWEEITLEQVQSTTRGHCSQSRPEAGCTNYLSEREDNCNSLSIEVPSDLVQRLGEIRLTAEDQNNTEHSINGYCRNQSVPSYVDVSIPALCIQNISEQMTVVNTYNDTQSEKSQMYSTKQSNNFSNDTSSNTEQFQQQDSHHIPSTSIHSSMPPLSSSQLSSLPVDMHSNNSPQTCTLLQQEPTSNGGFYHEAGLAGALAGGERGAIEDVWRRQNWEQGVIDYMGRDSFDNIWKKISESIGSKAAVPATAPVAAVPSTEAGEKSSAPPAASAETKETPSQQAAKEPTDSAVPPPVKAEQLEGAPVAAEQQAADKTATPLEKKDEASKTEIPKSEPAKEDASSKSEKVDVAEQAKVSPPTDAEASKEKTQDLPKSDTPTTPTQPVQSSEITPQKEGEQPKTEIPIQPLPAVPLPPPEAKIETPTDTKPSQEAKSDVVPTETKGTEEKTHSDKAGKEIVEAVVSKQEVPKTETTPPTPTECSKPDTAQPVIEAKSAEEKTDKPEAKESVPSDAHKTEEVKTPPVEVKTIQEAPKETLAATEKPAKDDSAPKEHSSQAAPKETPAGIAKEDSAPKVPLPPETPKEAIVGPKTPVKDDSVPKVPPSPAAPTETVSAAVCTPATPTGIPPAPTETPLASTVTPATPSAEKPVKDDAASKVPPSATAPKELPAGTEQPKKDDSAPKEPSSSVESKEAPKKDAPKIPTESAAVSKDVAPASAIPAEVPPPAATPSGPEVPLEAKPAAESKKSPPTSTPSTPQASPAEGASAAAAAPVPPKRKGNKEQKSGNGGKQSKSKK